MDLSGPGIDVKLKERKKERRPLLLSNLIIFLKFILNDLNCYKSATGSSTNHI